mgnify:CR=1 FL=1
MQRAVARAPEMALIRYNLGRVQVSLGYFRQGEEAYLHALAADGQDARILAALGRLYLLQGRAQAEQYLRGALLQDPENPEALPSINIDEPLISSRYLLWCTIPCQKPFVKVVCCF